VLILDEWIEPNPFMLDGIRIIDRVAERGE